MLTFPTLSTKTKSVIVVILVIAAFASGRYSVQKPKVVTTLVAQKNTQEKKQQNIHTKTTITETKQPSGIDTKVTVIDQVKDTDLNLNQQSDTQIQQTVTPPKANTLNISVLGANDFSKGLLSPTYGLSVQKQVLGPITVGAFGLMSGVVGVSVGLNF